LGKEPLFGSICATIVQPEMRRFFRPFVEPDRSSRRQEAIAGGLLIHSDPFALIDLRFFCYRYTPLICGKSPHLPQVLTNKRLAFHQSTSTLA
jgi:hypothetical protein